MASASMLTVAIFGMIPGGYRSLIDSYIQEYGDVGLAVALISLLHLDGDELASAVTDNLLGTVATESQKDIVRDILTHELAAGTNPGQLVTRLVDIVDALPVNDPNWGRVASRFDYLADISDYYSNAVGKAASTDMAFLRRIPLLIDDTLEASQSMKSDIDAQPTGIASDHGQLQVFLPAQLAGLAGLVKVNDEVGLLSSAALRSAIVLEVGESQYNQVLNPGHFDDGDGVLNLSELGFGNLGRLPATQVALENVFYGTFVQALKNVDFQEIVAINQFIAQNDIQLKSGQAVPALVELILEAYGDPAMESGFTNAEIATTIQLAGVAMIDAALGEQFGISPMLALISWDTP